MIVAGDDPIAAAWVAIGIAEREALHRQVIIVDLVGDLPPLRAGDDTDDVHGITDCLQFGISLERVARPLGDQANVRAVGAGLESPQRDEIVAHPRWRRIIDRVRASDALLLIVAARETPGLATLVEATDGVVGVGDAVPSTPEGLVASVATAPASRANSHDENATAIAPWRRKARLAGLMAAATTAAAAVVLLWAASRGVDGEIPRAEPAMQVSRGGVAPPNLASGAEVEALPAPDDREQFARFAVEVLATNTESGAIFYLRNDVADFPAATYVPVVLADGSRWFKVLVGAASDAATADSLLAELRRRGIVNAATGRIVEVPYALVVDEKMSRQSAAEAVSAYSARGLPVYALVRRDSTATLYAGAFATPGQASLLAAALRSASVMTVVRHRTGRTF